MKWTASRFESVKGLLFVCVIIVLLEGGKRSRSRDHHCCTVSIYKVVFLGSLLFYKLWLHYFGLTWRNQQTRFSHFKTTLHGQKNCFSFKFALVFLVPVPGGHAVCPSKHLKRLSRSTERSKYEATVAKSVCLLNITWSAVGVIIAEIM